MGDRGGDLSKSERRASGRKTQAGALLKRQPEGHRKSGAGRNDGRPNRSVPRLGNFQEKTGWPAVGDASEGRSRRAPRSGGRLLKEPFPVLRRREMADLRNARRQTLLPSVTCFSAANVGLRLLCGPKEGPMGGFVMVQEWLGLLDVLAVLGWTRPIGRGVWGLWCSNVQLRAARETAEQSWERRGSRLAAAAGAAGRAWRGGNYGLWSQAAGRC